MQKMQHFLQGWLFPPLVEAWKYIIPVDKLLYFPGAGESAVINSGVRQKRMECAIKTRNACFYTKACGNIRICEKGTVK
jgi:hypothetical protein